MTIEATTVYTKERMLKFNRYVVMSKKWFWIFMLICNIFMIADIASLIYFANFDWAILFLILIAVIDFKLLFGNFIAPRMAMKKQTVFNANIKYSLNEQHIHIQSSTDNFTAESTYNYSAIIKAPAQGDELYLFTSKWQAFVVDMSELSDEQKSLLRALLEDKIGAKKVKWK